MADVELTRKRSRWWLWFLVWAAIVLLDSPRQNPNEWGLRAVVISAVEWGMWVLLAPVIIYIDNAVPLQRDDISKRLILHVFLGLVLSAGTTLIHVHVVNSFTNRLTPGTWRVFYPSHIMIYCAIAGIYISYDYYRHFMERQLKATELEARLTQARLEALRAQLQPHFLFNTLNAISAQVESDPRSARRMLEQLGDLLRLSLANSSAHEISLDQEMAFTSRYIALQKIRFEDRLEVIENIDPDTLDAQVPAFILQPLVENAIRHGIERCARKGQIEVTAQRKNGHVVLAVRDNGPGIAVNAKSVAGRSGIGLANTRERLRYLYGDEAQSLKISSEVGKGTLVEIDIPFHAASEVSSTLSA
jgi:sensor histidine kinase YesM